MSHVELIWGAFFLMVLAALLTMCMKCQQSGDQQEKSGLSQQSSQIESQQILEAVRSCSVSGLEEARSSCRSSGTSKQHKNLSVPKQSSVPRQAGDRAKLRCKPSQKEMATDPETEYVEPLCADYYNCRQFLRPPNDEDSHSYENVIAPSPGSGCVVTEADIYENSTAIQLWRRTRVSESSTDEEPDYINAEVTCRPHSSRFA